MKKGLVVFGLVLILVLSLSVVSASWLGDLWGKITGRAVDDTELCSYLEQQCSDDLMAHGDSGTCFLNANDYNEGVPLSGRVVRFCCDEVLSANDCPVTRKANGQDCSLNSECSSGNCVKSLVKNPNTGATQTASSGLDRCCESNACVMWNSCYTNNTRLHPIGGNQVYENLFCIDSVWKACTEGFPSKVGEKINFEGKTFNCTQNSSGNYAWKEITPSAVKKVNSKVCSSDSECSSGNCVKTKTKNYLLERIDVEVDNINSPDTCCNINECAKWGDCYANNTRLKLVGTHAVYENLFCIDGVWHPCAESFWSKQGSIINFGGGTYTCEYNPNTRKFKWVLSTPTPTPTSILAPPTNVNAVDNPNDSGGYVNISFTPSLVHSTITSYKIYKNLTTSSTTSQIEEILILQKSSMVLGAGNSIASVIVPTSDSIARNYWVLAEKGGQVSTLAGPNIAVPINNTVCDRADLNADGVINQPDLDIVMLIFSSTAEYDPAIDLNSDGEINALDINYISSKFRQTIAQPPCPVSPTQTCTDSDVTPTIPDGKNRFVSGIVNDAKNNRILHDLCINALNVNTPNCDSNCKVAEQYCDSNGDGVNLLLPCISGCNDGACIPPEGRTAAVCTQAGTPDVSPGTRMRRGNNNALQYCNPATLNFAAAKTKNELCISDYECISNVCIDGKCTSISEMLAAQQSLLKQIWCALTNPIDVFKRNTQGQNSLNNDYLKCVASPTN